MALARYVVTANVTLTPDTVAAIVAGEPGTGGPAEFGNSATIIPSALGQGKYGLPGMPLTLLAGTPVWADSAAGFATAPQLLYHAVAACHLRDRLDTVRRGQARLATS